MGTSGEGASRLLLRDEVYAVVGAAIEVSNGLGAGFDEKAYENALVIEFRLRGIPFVQQARYPLMYKGERVGEFVPDLVAFDALIVETKVVEALGDVERGQVLNYLQVSGLRVGVLLNFRQAKLEWERMVR